jgi:hypothetical protein
MNAAGELTGVLPVIRQPLSDGLISCADRAENIATSVICDESISDGSLVLRGSQRFFFFLG